MHILEMLCIERTFRLKAPLMIGLSFSRRHAVPFTGGKLWRDVDHDSLLSIDNGGSVVI